MTPADRAAMSRAEQGLPEHVADPAALARVVALMRVVAPAGSGVAA